MAKVAMRVAMRSSGRANDAAPDRSARWMIAMLAALAWAGPAAAQDASALVDRAAAYVEVFQRDFGAMVAEERYEQAIRPVAGSVTRSGRGVAGPQQTVLVSDFLLVQVPGEGW